MKTTPCAVTLIAGLSGAFWLAGPAIAGTLVGARAIAPNSVDQPARFYRVSAQ